jgi:hypothetical protein
MFYTPTVGLGPTLHRDYRGEVGYALDTAMFGVGEVVAYGLLAIGLGRQPAAR